MGRGEWVLHCARVARERILGLMLWGDEGDYLGVGWRVEMLGGSMDRVE